MKNGLSLTSVNMKQEPFIQGDIWLTDLEPTKGAEMKKTRPCVVVSRTKINVYLDTLTVIPLTSGLKKARILRINVPKSAHNGLDHDSCLEIVQIRALSHQRCLKKLGRLEAPLFESIKEAFYEYFWKDLHREGIIGAWRAA